MTLYDSQGFLVKNVGSNPNAIGIPFVQNHQACLNADGSLDLYIQANAPSDAKQFCNWLETPASGQFILFLRVYWPDAAVLNGTWNPPPIVKQ